MGFLETLRTKKTFSVIFAIALLGVAGAVTGINYWPQKQFSRELAYFSDDDGKTWYADSIDHIPPYDHNGKEAVRAVIYSYADGKTDFCGYLMRFGPDVRKSLDAAIAGGAKANPPVRPHVIAYGIEFGTRAEVKSPGKNGGWIAMTSDKAAPVLQMKSPDGSALDSVLP